MAANLQPGPFTPSVNALSCLAGTVAYVIFSPPNNTSLHFAVCITGGGVQSFQSGETANLVGGGASFASLDAAQAAIAADIKTR
jgi:hypothetical protein